MNIKQKAQQQSQNKWRKKFRSWLRNFLCNSLIKVVVASLLYLYLKSDDLEAFKTAFELVDFIV